MIKKEILQALDRDDLTPPLCWIMTCLPPSASPGPEAALMPDPGPGEVSATATAPPPAFPEFTEPPFGQALILVTEASGQHFQDPAPTKSPKLYPPLPMSTDKKGRETLELSRDCALPESRGNEREQTRDSASCCSGKVYLGPSGKHLPQGQDSPSTGPKGGPGPVTAKPVCLVPRFWPLEG
ncbi:unnamed protein product [Rangifer tarandus platyrhynchus]|uniref:Uncharacterized protein n=2 Tax=Rangifer tarandus platyrhynchus TaxID=3082113 RepID=A0ABN8XVA2_RANTA|nr:unnamed protein product [Rangifer tarandus platyrhynchus]